MLGRIKALYNTLGLSTEDGTINMGEIKAYCSAMDLLKEMIALHCDEEHISKPTEYTHSEINSRLHGALVSYTSNNGYFTAYGANIDKIGYLCDCWINPFFKIKLGATGKKWSTLNNTWRELDNRSLRWSMIETQ